MNRIHYKDYPVIDLDKNPLDGKDYVEHDFFSDEIICYQLCFSNGTYEPIKWDFDEEEERDKVYNYLISKYFTDIEVEMEKEELDAD